MSTYVALILKKDKQGQQTRKHTKWQEYIIMFIKTYINVSYIDIQNERHRHIDKQQEAFIFGVGTAENARSLW